MGPAAAIREPTVTSEAAAEASAPSATPKRQRLTSVDAVRGLIMIVMALDHTRDFLGLKLFVATDLAKTTPVFFFTRWITHYCAPGFMLLAGTAAYLSGKDRPALSRFLLSRGLWLVFAELTFVNLAWSFSVSYPVAGVIWALGWSMIALAALIWLPPRWLGVFAVSMIALHNLFDGIKAAPLLDSSWHLTGTARDWTITLLHQMNPPIVYPVIPWIAVMALGFVLGPVFQLEASARTRKLALLGLGSIALFLVLRLPNLYGDASTWTAQGRGPVFTLLSFLNTTKYPPSLLYLLMTLGPLFLALAAAERIHGPIERVLSAFGRAPFFYYVLHLCLIHAVAIVVGVAQGFPATELFVPFWRFPKGFGVGLPAVYVAWVGVVVALYWPTRWFAEVKARRRDWWLSYL